MPAAAPRSTAGRVPCFVPCPCCGKAASYSHRLDRYFHDDGSDNSGCWADLVRTGGPLHPAPQWSGASPTVEARARAMTKTQRADYLTDRMWVRISREGAQTWRAPDVVGSWTLAAAVRFAMERERGR